MTIIAVWVNCPNHETARRISDVLVGERLAACTNILPEIQSAFHWKGNVELEREVPLVAKTRGELFQAICETIRELHPYEIPGVFAMVVAHADPEYEAWVISETEGSAPA